MSRSAARLLFPAVRWDPAEGDWRVGDPPARLASGTGQGVALPPAWAGLGVGGWIVFGGTAAGVRDLAVRLREASPHPILIGADLERGAGQQFDGATGLPPAAALAWLDDLDVTRRAGHLTGREATALGVDWVYAPVADVDVEPANPIVGTRAFGADPETAARQVEAWVEGCRAGGAMACVKHFPGHGRTTADSHVALPVVDAAAPQLEAELAPFEAAFRAGAESVMTAHVAYPALDPEGRPATLSRPILHGLLRARGFHGLVVTDALIMEGARAGLSPEAAAVGAVAAGCDALLYPGDPVALASALTAARQRELPAHRLDEAADRVAGAAQRMEALRQRAGGPGSGGEAGGIGASEADGVDGGEVGRVEDRAWALEVATRTIHAVRGGGPRPGPFRLVTVDDDVGGPHPPPSRSSFPTALRSEGMELTEAVDGGAGPAGVGLSSAPVLVAVYADIRGFKGRPGLSPAALSAVRRAVAAGPSSLVVLFGHPRLAEELRGDAVVCAWGGEPIMQRAAARWLVGGHP